jgi:colanic acid biosynthesis protein WcaH
MIIHRLSRELFETIVDCTPLISIDLIVRDENDEVLLGERLNAPAREFWFTPGGRIYKNEPMAEAFRRISRDELGFEVPMDQAQFIGTFEHFYDDSVFGDHVSTHYVVLAYSLIASNDQIVINDQHNTYRWQSIDSLLTDETVHTHVKWYFR